MFSLCWAKTKKRYWNRSRRKYKPLVNFRDQNKLIFSVRAVVPVTFGSVNGQSGTTTFWGGVTVRVVPAPFGGQNGQSGTTVVPFGSIAVRGVPVPFAWYQYLLGNTRKGSIPSF